MGNWLTLKEIKELKSGQKEISIPALQRGLVWNAKQVEFLWDSILRGFPIGGFVVVDNDNKLEIIDGQQRLNAIYLGFKEPNEDNTTSEILWWDIKQESNYARKYFIKVSSKTDPWGYKNDDDCTRLKAEERRTALSIFFKNEIFNIYKDEFNLSQVFPTESKFPIPLSFFLNTTSYNDLVKKIETLPASWKGKYWSKQNKKQNKEYLEDYYSSKASIIIKEALDNYSIPYSVLPNKIFTCESKQEEDKVTALEILFNRLGSMGTQISSEELRYSAIKSYWPNIKEQNEKLAENLLPPQQLIPIIFRLVLSEENSNEFYKDLTIGEIRDIAINESKKAKKEKIENFYTNREAEAEKIVDKLKSELHNKMIPPHLVMKMGREIPDAFLFAMYLIRKYGNDSSFEQLNITGLLLLLLWFCNKSCTSKVINYWYSKIQSKESIEEVRECIADAIIYGIGQDWIDVIYSPDEIRDALTNDDYLISDFNANPINISLVNLWYDKSLLLFAQRKYLSENYRNYNPMDTKRWQYNICPWDFDHIVPQNWVRNKHNVSQDFKDWIDTIGNLAAIPFEVNRAKHDDASYDYYANRDDLIFDDRFIKFGSEDAKDNDKGKLFAKVVFDRFLNIYSDCYNAFSSCLDFNSALESIEAKKMYDELKQNPDFEGLQARYVLGALEYNIEYPIDWAHRWISFELDINDYCVASISFYKQAEGENRDIYEVGLRKHPSLQYADYEWYEKNKEALESISKETKIPNFYSSWWFLYKGDNSYKDAVELFKGLISNSKLDELQKDSKR